MRALQCTHQIDSDAGMCGVHGGMSEEPLSEGKYIGLG